jgi:murein DD-endopeptidase MepM/ murein hydrolase activator NlpD
MAMPFSAVLLKIRNTLLTASAVYSPTGSEGCVMSHCVTSRERRLFRSGTLAVSLLVAGLASGCSTDVQRFGQTGSLGSTAAVEPAPVGEVERAPLGLAGGPSRSPYMSVAENSLAATPASYYGDAASAPAGAVVTVRPGDTAFSLARANAVTVQELAAANDLAFPYNIKIGQRLTIPDAGGASAAAAPEPARVAARGASHTVSPGDTLFNISQRYGIGIDRLAEANSLDDLGRIRIGQNLRIPEPGGAAGAGGPLQLAARSLEADAEVAGGARILKPRLIEADEASPAGAGEAGLGAAETRPEPADRAVSKFRWPARGRIISRYGISADGQRNDGINISVPEGASVKAAEDGVVAYAGDELKGYGNLVLIRHANDWVTAYAHNSAILVQRGDTVQRGQIIAKAGQTGSVDKPQLHFEVRQGSKAVDPMPYLEGA